MIRLRPGVAGLRRDKAEGVCSRHGCLYRGELREAHAGGQRAEIAGYGGMRSSIPGGLFNCNRAIVHRMRGYG